MSSCRQVLAALALAIGCVLGLAAQSPKSQFPKSQWAGVYTDAQAMRGEPLYVENCSMCHGLKLAGTVLAPPLAGPTFNAKWNRRALSLVFNILQTQMPLNLSGHLSPQQNAEVLAYMLRAGDHPSGAVDLPAGADALKAITILEQKP
ncbi:MAG: c-type cytochrome [Vicinamibacterales bacterium]